MKIKNYLLQIAILSMITSCVNSNYRYSDLESTEFLNQITKHAKASITDITEVKKQPTDLFGIITRYPLPKNKLEEYHKNHGTIVNTDDDISDFATYTLKSYELINEHNEKLNFVDDGRAIYLEEYGLWEYDKILYQNLGISFKLNGKFSTLRGYINMEFEMPHGEKKEIRIPVNISINDRISE
ncbi:hypothetical protein PBAL39_14604 [Pedobacter sp. BAL39]|uniref:hypothetical protein n=1 Tax=Pedobacter sp. BAL39 TaxID=391596 RepID=UPI00015594C8|nr:hypothetical protein [Pedobacter sp. BAL39]EDM37664.1 hypothetical protein PBAL39_14604 [Pedobacter sp. BAL39]